MASPCSKRRRGAALALFAAALLVASLRTGAAAAELPPTRKVEGKIHAPGLDTSGVRISLNGGERTTYSRGDGAFAFDGVVAGVYLLEFEPLTTPDGAFLFSSYKVQVPVAGATRPDGAAADIAVLEYRYAGAPKLPAKHPIEAVPVAPAVFFEERPRTSIWTFIMNPQILMMIVMGVMVIGMPMMMVRAACGGVCAVHFAY